MMAREYVDTCGTLDKKNLSFNCCWDWQSYSPVHLQITMRCLTVRLPKVLLF